MTDAPIRVELGGADEVWLAPSLSEPKFPRLILLFADGTWLCSCKRRDKGCRHKVLARDEQAKELALDEFARQESFREELIHWALEEALDGPR